MRWLISVGRGLQAILFAAGAAQPLTTKAQEQNFGSTEERVWFEAREAGTPEAFARYLELYPIGRFAEQAFSCLISDESGGSGDPACQIGPAAGPVAPETSSPSLAPDPGIPQNEDRSATLY